MFEDWSKVIGGVLSHAGIPGFLGNLADMYAENDAEGTMWRIFFAKWWWKFGEASVGVADLCGLISDDMQLPLGDGSEQDDNG